MSKAICRVPFKVGALLAALLSMPVHAVSPHEEGSGPSARDFLADESRVGGLAGTLLGGALTAHPAGTVVGAVLGYVVGKKSDFTSDEEPASASTDAATAPAAAPAPVNPLAECFGDRGRRAVVARQQAPSADGLEAGADDGLVSLVSFQAIDSASARPALSRVASAGETRPDNRRRVISPCYYYSSW